MITTAQIQKSVTYSEYIELTKSIIENPSPTAPYDNEKMLKYTEANLERMQRVSSNIAIDQKLYNLLNSVNEKWIWVIITEPWCGDAAQIVPALCAFADVNENIETKLILRDTNLDLIDAYLTNGGRSIPKLICVKAENLEEIGTWGPRPQEIQVIVDAFISDTTTSFGQKVRQIHEWYDDNKSAALQEEFIALLQDWKAKN
jgi:hypothetical protein